MRLRLLYEEYRNGKYLISTDPQRLDVDAIHAYLVQSYWAEGIPREMVFRSLQNSLCFGIFDDKQQVGHSSRS
jgi:hypothetical protein